MTSEIAYTTSSADDREGWDAIDRALLSAIRHGASSVDLLVVATEYPRPIVADAVHAYLCTGYAVRDREFVHHVELTLSGWARLGALSGAAQATAIRQAA